MRASACIVTVRNDASVHISRALIMTARYIACVCVQYRSLQLDVWECVALCASAEEQSRAFVDFFFAGIDRGTV